MDTKTLLTVGAVGVVAYLIWQHYNGSSPAVTTGANPRNPATPAGNSSSPVNTAVATGSGVVTGIGNLYGEIENLFGGGTSSGGN